MRATTAALAAAATARSAWGALVPLELPHTACTPCWVSCDTLGYDAWHYFPSGEATLGDVPFALAAPADAGKCWSGRSVTAPARHMASVTRVHALMATLWGQQQQFGSSARVELLDASGGVLHALPLLGNVHVRDYNQLIGAWNANTTTRIVPPSYNAWSHGHLVADVTPIDVPAGLEGAVAGVRFVDDGEDNYQRLLVFGVTAEGTPTTASSTPAATKSGSASGSATPSGSPAATPSRSPAATPSGSPAATPSGSPSGSPAATPSGSSAATPSGSPAATPSGSSAATPSGSSAATPSDNAAIAPSSSTAVSPSRVASPEQSPAVGASRSRSRVARSPSRAARTRSKTARPSVVHGIRNGCGYGGK